MNNPSIRIPYGLSVYDEEEINAVVKVLSEHRSNMGIETRNFESKVSKLFGKKFGVMVNSGSSANLLATILLSLPKNSEVITPALTFSTTVAPLIQMHLKPIFVDVQKGKYIIDENLIEKKINKNTKAIMLPLLLGNVPNMNQIKSIARKHKLFIIEDSCDTLGATYNGIPTGKYTDISTTSFFGSHIITAGGNGGMLMINDPKLVKRAILLRGWGRTSSLFTETEDIKKRFSGKLNNIPYDNKFIFTEIGYNFLPSEMGAAFGNIQLKKLPKFRKIRNENFIKLSKIFKKYENFFILPIQDAKVNTQWLAFPLTIKPDAPFSRIEIATFLEKNNVQTRPIFTGNIIKQPGFENALSNNNYKDYPNTNEVMERGFVVGCHHGITDEHIKRLNELFDEFLAKYK